MYPRFLCAGSTQSRPNSRKTSSSLGVSTSSHSVSSFVSDFSDKLQPLGRRHNPCSFRRAPALLACDRICLTNSASPVTATRAGPLLPEGIRLEDCYSQRAIPTRSGRNAYFRSSRQHFPHFADSLSPLSGRCAMPCHFVGPEVKASARIPASVRQGTAIDSNGEVARRRSISFFEMGVRPVFRRGISL